MPGPTNFAAILERTKDISEKIYLAFPNVPAFLANKPTFFKTRQDTFCDTEFDAELKGNNFKSQKGKTRKLIWFLLIALFHFEINLITNNGFSLISDNLDFFQVSLKCYIYILWEEDKTTLLELSVCRHETLRTK